MSEGRQLRLRVEKIEEWLDGRRRTWLALKLDVSGQTVRNMLAGEVPNSTTLINLAHLMGCQVEDLISPREDEQSA